VTNPFIWGDVIRRLARDFRLAGGAIGQEGSARAVTAVIEALDLQDLTRNIYIVSNPEKLERLPMLQKLIC
jgi:hypothetical protein